HPRLRLPRAARYGDLSYGVYVWAFPVQQLVASSIGDRVEWWHHLVAALPITLALALASWHLLEEPALRLKARFPRPAASTKAVHLHADGLPVALGAAQAAVQFGADVRKPAPNLAISASMSRLARCQHFSANGVDAVAVRDLDRLGVSMQISRLYPAIEAR